MVLDAVAAIGFAPRSALTKIQDPLKRSSLPIRSWPSRIGHIPMRPPSNNSTANISEHQLSANGQDIQQQSFYRAHVTRVVLLPVC